MPLSQVSKRIIIFFYRDYVILCQILGYACENRAKQVSCFGIEALLWRSGGMVCRIAQLPRSHSGQRDLQAGAPNSLQGCSGSAPPAGVSGPAARGRISTLPTQRSGACVSLYLMQSLAVLQRGSRLCLCCSETAVRYAAQVAASVNPVA